MGTCSLCNGEGYAIDLKGNESPCPFCNGTGGTKMNDSCEHEKVYENRMMMSYPPKKNWICKKCGAKGITVIGVPVQKTETYEEIRKRFKS